jgi:hypothetical protein
VNRFIASSLVVTTNNENTLKIALPLSQFLHSLPTENSITEWFLVFSEPWIRKAEVAFARTHCLTPYGANYIYKSIISTGPKPAFLQYKTKENGIVKHGGGNEDCRIVRRRGSHIFRTISSQMAARLSALRADTLLPPARYLVLISVRG